MSKALRVAVDEISPQYHHAAAAVHPQASSGFAIAPPPPGNPGPPCYTELVTLARCLIFDAPRDQAGACVDDYARFTACVRRGRSRNEEDSGAVGHHATDAADAQDGAHRAHAEHGAHRAHRREGAKGQ